MAPQPCRARRACLSRPVVALRSPSRHRRSARRSARRKRQRQLGPSAPEPTPAPPPAPVRSASTSAIANTCTQLPVTAAPGVPTCTVPCFPSPRRLLWEEVAGGKRGRGGGGGGGGVGEV
ncbi:unnamed protein product [Closterium sp. NIES-53]